MIFVDNTEERSKTHERFAYKNKSDGVELVNANINYPAIEIQNIAGERISCIYYEDIPKLILALQAAYDFKFIEGN